MNGSKLWYTSKTVWLGVVVTLIGALPLVADLVAKTTISPQDVILTGVGVLTVILRVWFTDTAVAH